MISTIRRTALALIAVSFLTATASANLIFNVTLTGAQEFPANNSPAIGTAIALFNQSTGAMSISGSYSGMLGNVNNAHLHGFSAPGVNSGIVFGLTHTGGFSGTITGNGVIQQIDIQKVLNGLTYINVHSTQFPGGEIRGQLVNPVPEPSAGLLALISGSGAIAGRYRRRKSC